MSASNHLSSEPYGTLGPLGSTLRVADAGGAGTNVVRHALREGRRFVTVHTSQTASGTIVECDVHSSPEATARTLGPYTFATYAEARSFGDELMRALEYLGCLDYDLVEDER